MANTLSSNSAADFLLDASIATNVSLEFVKKDEYDKLKSSLSKASMIDYVDALSEGVMTEIGEELFVGGQRQRLILARAFIMVENF